MKRSLAVAVGTVLLLVAGMPLAQDAKAPASNPSAPTMQPGSSMRLGGPVEQMDEHMKTMQALHEKMASATTPEERQKVMTEQRTEMQSCMGMMNQMHSGGMMGGMDGGKMAQKGKPVDQKTQMQMMEKRLDMMQMMMQTMMDRSDVMAGANSGAATPKM
jgi:hypothetical protein